MKNNTQTITIILSIMLFVILLIIFLLLSQLYNFGNLTKLSFLKEKIILNNEYSPIHFILLYSIASILFIPITYLTINGGIIFGPISGTIYSVIGILIGSLISFFLARILLKPFLEMIVKEKCKELYKVDLELEDRGILVVVLLRALPIPFNLVNLFVGITKVKFKDFLIGTLIWMIPESFIFAYLGYFLNEIKIMKLIIFIVLITILYFTQKKLRRFYKNLAQNTKLRGLYG